MSATRRPSAVAGLKRGLGGGQAGPEPETPKATHASDLPPRPPKPVRITTDLTADRHLFLRQFAAECGAGVSGADVIRALLDELREGSNLPARVKARIWAANR